MESLMSQTNKKSYNSKPITPNKCEISCLGTIHQDNLSVTDEKTLSDITFIAFQGQHLKRLAQSSRKFY